MAQQLIASLATDFEPSKYHDDYRAKVLDLVERKAQGEEIAIQPEAERPTKVPDLMAALEESLAAVQGTDLGGDGGSKSKPKPNSRAKSSGRKSSSSKPKQKPKAKPRSKSKSRS